MEFLRRNAEYFERKALEAFEEKAYGFAVYFAEQALQLYLKYILAKEVGDYPETRSFSQLFRALSRIDEHAEAFYEENADVLDISRTPT
ncbi:MAG: HEPN domain-containing protein [Candidatus Korarchaeum sp.]